MYKQACACKREQRRFIIIRCVFVVYSYPPICCSFLFRQNYISPNLYFGLLLWTINVLFAMMRCFLQMFPQLFVLSLQVKYDGLHDGLFVVSSNLIIHVNIFLHIIQQWPNHLSLTGQYRGLAAHFIEQGDSFISKRTFTEIFFLFLSWCDWEFLDALGGCRRCPSQVPYKTLVHPISTCINTW